MQDASGRAEEFLGRLHASISQEDSKPGALSYSEVLGRRVRTGGWEEQKISTLDMIEAALTDREFAQAAELADFQRRG